MTYSFMVLEDDDIFMELNNKIISKSGFASKVENFDYAQAGLDYLFQLSAEGKSFPDFILLDLRMPIINGFEFLEKLKSIPDDRLSHTKIHLLTSSLDEQDIERAFSYPHVWGFHSKPLNLKKLQDIVTATEVIRPGKI